MVNRVQTLRSSLSGSRPAAGTRTPGELFLNFADRQIGYIDPSQAPVDLLPITVFMTASAYAAGAYVIYQGQLYQARAAVPAGTFNPAQWTTVGGSITVAASAPANPFQGQLWWDSVSGQLFVFYDDGNSQQWVVAINEKGSYLSTSGGSLTGAISGPGNGGAVLSQNDPPAGDNSKALATTSWVQSTLAGRQNRNRIINGQFTINQRFHVSGSMLAANAYGLDRWKAGAGGCTFTFTNTVPNTVTITAGSLMQVVEGLNIEDGAYTLSWQGAAQGRVYQGTAGGYASSPITVTGLVADGDTIVEFSAGTVLKPQLELGVQATPFDWRPYGEELVLCQRYYQIGSFALQGYGSGSMASSVISQSFAATMRVTPTVTGYSTSFGPPGGAQAWSIGPNSSGGYNITLTFASAAQAWFTGNFTADAEL